MKRKSKETALSAVACAFSTLGLTVGTLYSPMLFTGYLIACLCMMLPLSKGYFKGAALCFVATNVLTLLFNGFNFFDTLPYTLFFGLHPLVNEVQARLHTRRNKKKAGADVGNVNAGGLNDGSFENSRSGDGVKEEARGNGQSGQSEQTVPTEQTAAAEQKQTEEWEMDWDAPVATEDKKAASAVKREGGNGKVCLTDLLFSAVKICWFDAAMFFVWKVVFSANTAVPFIDAHILPVLLIGGSLFFIFYDFLAFRMRKSINYLIDKFLGKK
ncbi:MAG: hypothetical protein ACI4SH_08365 [Candidatus Scatosoma sp.]